MSEPEYRKVYVPPNHPLRTPHSKSVSIHRLVLFDKIGPGESKCHWCGKAIKWYPRRKITTDSIVSDHLDDNIENNNPGNLMHWMQFPTK